MENEVTKKKASGFKLFLLLVAGFILVSFLLQAAGMKVMDVKESDKMIERPHED